MDMGLVHNREARPPSVVREHPDPPRDREQPVHAARVLSEAVPKAKRTGVRADEPPPGIELAQPKGPGFGYESGRAGVECVLYSKTDGSVMQRIPVRRRLADPTDLDLKA